ncbi:MAG: HAMP domain-containing sensor histidine kinase [Lachnospiraceae bacterium]|nr:HAMP domain-containing histidine kinase [Robinsoniella sp.]MDY3767240.1 HAMP domain-containing sensor histidine kinase [Lachnospiraceae bacterium]
MIKDLRKKFIIVAMCSIFGVLAAIMGIINILNYCRMVDHADGMTAFLADRNGEFWELPFEWDLNVGMGERPKDPGPNNFSPETPYETRFFWVMLDEEGNVIDAEMGSIAAVSEEDAAEFAQKIFVSQSQKGFEGIYRYRAKETDHGTMILFLDCRQDLMICRTFLLTTAGVSAVGMLAVFLLVLIFSRIVFRPVAESYEKQKRFITDASHELKTPLTIIEANTEVIEMEGGENQWTKSIRNQVKRLVALTQQLIILLRLDEEDGMKERAEFSMSDAVSETIQSFESLVRMKEKRLKDQIEEGICFVGNEKMIRQMIGILLDNAVKYSPDGTEIKVCLKKKGKKICLEVLNQTEEIPKGKLDVLFERFYRIDSSRNSETGGSGIGLSVAKAIVSSHKGKIEAYSADGKSLRVTVVL